MTSSPSPRSLGYRLPAEWEPHEATWLSWPHNRDSWPGKFDPVEPAYAAMVREIAAGETVHLNVNDAETERRAQRYLADAGATGDIVFQHLPTDDAWCRDHGAIFLTGLPDVDGTERLAATDWRYNAWGGKYPHGRDERIAAAMAETLGIPRFAFEMVLEGGSIDGNGAGALLTTEACLLHPNRNPQLSRADIEDRLRDGLAARDILWLGDGIAGDDTDGHVDDLTRFVAERTVVTVVEPDPADENHQPLTENRRRLGEMTINGRPLEVIELPMPPVLLYDGQRLPASYANFYVCNAAVLLPGYHAPTDLRAAAILRDCFPTRDVIVLDATDLVWGLGAFHCLTQQVPRSAAAR